MTPAPGQTFAPPPFIHFTNQTLRQIVRTSLGGARVRVVLSNAFGTAPLTIGAAHVALARQGRRDSSRRRRRAHVQRPADDDHPVVRHRVQRSRALAIAPLTDLAIDVYLPGTTNTPSPLTMHGAALSDELHLRDRQSCRQREAADGRDDAKLVLAVARRGGCARQASGVIVAFGDSITDGAASTADTNRRWPDLLAARLTLSSAVTAWRRQRRHRRQPRAE